MLLTILEFGIAAPAVYGAYKTFKHANVPTPVGHFAPGMPKPSHVLAGMVATYILRNLENVSGNVLVLTKQERCTHLYGDRFRQAVYKDKKMKVAVEIEFRDRLTSGGYKPQEYTSSVSVSFEGKPYSFDVSDQKIIMNAMKKATSLRHEFVKQKEIEAKQQVAVDIIEQLFKTKPEALPQPVKKKEAGSGEIFEEAR